MKVDKKSMFLYGITDRSWVGERTLMEQVEESLKGGVTFLQLREKQLSRDEILKEAKEMKKMAARYQVPFVINDNVDIALASGADGVHVGPKDMDVRMAREKLGPDKIIGASCRSVEAAIKAEEMGADYLGVGAVFATSTKEDAKVISKDLLKAICEAVTIPVVAIGGIKEDNMMTLKGSGVSGICMISGIYAQKDIEGACGRLLNHAKEIVEG